MGSNWSPDPSRNDAPRQAQQPLSGGPAAPGRSMTPNSPWQPPASTPTGQQFSGGLRRSTPMEHLRNARHEPGLNVSSSLYSDSDPAAPIRSEQGNTPSFQGQGGRKRRDIATAAATAEPWWLRRLPHSLIARLRRSSLATANDIYGVETDQPANLPSGGSRIIGIITADRRQTQRNIATVYSSGIAAIAIFVISALVIFNPFAQANTFPFVPGSHPFMTNSNETTIIAGGSGATPTPTPRPQPTPTHRPAPKATPTTHSQPSTKPTPPPAPTARPTATPTAVPTPTNTTPPTVDNASLSNPGGQTQDPGTNFSVSITATNTGTTTWSAGNGYALVCEAGCLNAGTQSLPSSLAPNQSYTFTIGMNGGGAAPGGGMLNDAPSNTGAVWQMQHNGADFGNQAQFNIHIRGWATVYGPLNPCPGQNSWVAIRATAGCSYLTTSINYYPEMDLQTAPENTGQFRMEVHVNLSSADPGQFEGDLILNTPRGLSNFGGVWLGVRNNGQADVWECSSSAGCPHNLWATQAWARGTSFDLETVVYGGAAHFYIGGSEVYSMATSNIPNAGSDEGLIQWWFAENNGVDTSSWSNFQLANWQ